MILKGIMLILIMGALGQGMAPPFRTRRQSPAYGITNYEINEKVKRLIRETRDTKDKLIRHEGREANLAAFVTKTLNALVADHGATKKILDAIRRQLSSVEEKMFAMEALISTTDERQRKKLGGLSEGLNRLLIQQPKLEIPLPPFPAEGNPAVEAEIQNILRKVAVIDDTLKRDVNAVNNEIKSMGKTLNHHMEHLNTRQDRLWNEWNTCQKEQYKSLDQVSESLSQTGALFVEQVKEANKLILKGGPRNDCSKMTNEVVDRLNSLDKAYHDQEQQLEGLNQATHMAMREQKQDLETLLKETRNEQILIESHFSGVLENLKALESQSKHHLVELVGTLKNTTKENVRELMKKIEKIDSTLRLKTLNILNALDDAAGMSENIQTGMVDNFEELSKNIKGIKKVEQVMLSTADAVLDTKRSIEFGIQQVILELGEAVKSSGKNNNSTLSDHINNISFAILKNQTSALTNMTQKMENEISQVWRQIGIMYQQIAQSVNILGELKTSTSQHMNASLDKVDTMDGTVGAINNKVADVEDNLNYLLGRLSLVVAEFSQMKTGVGYELERLRDMAKEFSAGDVVEYRVHQKRAIEKNKGKAQRHNGSRKRKHYKF